MLNRLLTGPEASGGGQKEERRTTTGKTTTVTSTRVVRGGTSSKQIRADYGPEVPSASSIGVPSHGRYVSGGSGNRYEQQKTGGSLAKYEQLTSKTTGVTEYKLQPGYREQKVEGYLAAGGAGYEYAEEYGYTGQKKMSLAD